MANDINLFVATGRIDGAVDYRTSKAGKPYARFTLVSTRVIRDTAEDATYPCVCFGGLADRVVAGAKGGLYVAGRFKTERWEYQGKPCQKLMLQIDDLRTLTDSVTEPAAQGNHSVSSGGDAPPF